MTPTPANDFGAAATGGGAVKSKERAPISADDWLKSQCNRYVNGYCGTLACLRRGGYGGAGMHVDYECATCEPHEIWTELQRLRTEADVRAHLRQFSD